MIAQLIHGQSRWILWCGIASLAIAVQGCSMFSSRPNGSGDSSSFKASASADANPIPLPVEITHDISKIAGGGEPDPVEGWQPSASNADGTADAEESADSASEKPLFPNRKPAQAGGAHKGGKTQTYVVKNGDTLMKISFEKYGNVYRWREIYDANRSKIKNYNAVPPGTVLTINGVEYVVIDRNGTPYLIRRHDTLAKISNSVYGTPVLWRGIWKNNPQLIHDPNKIYAGFTLYYQDKTDVQKPLAKSTLPAKAKAQVPASKGKSAKTSATK